MDQRAYEQQGQSIGETVRQSPIPESLDELGATVIRIHESIEFLENRLETVTSQQNKATEANAISDRAGSSRIVSRVAEINNAARAAITRLNNLRESLEV